MKTLSGKNGGGQILRSALTLSMITGEPFRLSQIRGSRPKPGLMRQHLTCVQAAVEISDGSVDGAEIGSIEIIFHPGKVRAGDYSFAIGTAGSTTLLAQTLLPALWQVEGDSTLKLSGGTHNPMAPPFDFLSRVYLRALKTMRITIKAELQHYGFVPAGGGKLLFTIPGGQTPKPLVLRERGELLSQKIHCLGAHLPKDVPGKETRALMKGLDWSEDTVEIETTEKADCAGNVLAAEVRFENVTERVSAFGAQGRTSRNVAGEVIKMIKNHLGSDAVVGRQLADQLLLPMALAGGGEFITGPLTNHIQTNQRVIESFLPVSFVNQELDRGCHLIKIG